jgi:predicted nucleotidyltransferase
MRDLENIRKTVLEILEPYGVKRVALFGSVVREEDKPDSDIDILVELEEPRRKPLGFFTWVRLEREISERLGKQVDLVSSGALSPYIRPHVEEEMLLLYEQAR